MMMDIIFRTLATVCTFTLLCYGLTETKTVEVTKQSQDAKIKNDCCSNNGICVLGTFCRCKKNYYGRYCEHRIDFRSCGHIPHGSWIKADCDLCKCFDGKMSCIPRIYDGCDYDNSLLLKDSTTKDPLKAKKIKVLGNDRDYQDDQPVQFNLEDYYYDDEDNSSDCVSVRWYILTIAATVAFILR